MAPSSNGAAEPSANPDEAPDAASDSEGAPTDFASVWNQDFMRQALFAGVLVALVCGYLGVYVVLKRIVFIGVALSEFSSAGIALAIFSGFNPLLGALGFMLLGVTLFALHISPRRVPHESFIGIIYVIAGALAILLIAKSHAGETHMLHLLQGDVLLIDPQETRQMFIAFGGLGVIHMLFIKPFVLTSFDRDSASTLGFRAQGWDFLLFLTIGLAIAFSIRAAGTLMTTTMLILPAATALLLVNRLKWAFAVAPLVAVIPVAAGLHLSFVGDVPASAVIVALSFLLFLPALAFNAFAKR
jgi:zinc transport system permease protein